MKTIRGWNQYIKDSQKDPIRVPLWGKTVATVHYPTKEKMKQIFDEDTGNLKFDTAAVALFGEDHGTRLLKESETQQGAPLEWMICEVMVEFGLLTNSVLAQFAPPGDDTDTDSDSGGEDPNPQSSSS